MTDHAGQMHDVATIRKYILGGNARFSLLNGPTRVTFKLRTGKKDKTKNWSTANADKSILFLSYQTGSNNDSDYTYLGFMRQSVNGNFVLTPARGLDPDHRIVKFFKDFWYMLDIGCRVATGYEVWHDGTCCVCGRSLTVPESVASGIGPECAGRE